MLIFSSGNSFQIGSISHFDHTLYFGYNAKKKSLKFFDEKEIVYMIHILLDIILYNITGACLNFVVVIVVVVVVVLMNTVFHLINTSSLLSFLSLVLKRKK